MCSADSKPDLLVTLFTQGALAACREEAMRRLSTGNATGPHPLDPLLPVAEQLNRRDDLIGLVIACQEEHPEDCRLLELSATLHMQTGAFDEAGRAIDAALARRPAHLPALAIQARLLTQAGRLDEALRVLERIQELNPDNPSNLSNIAYLRIALGDVDEALNLYRQSILRQPNHPQMRLNYSIALLKAGYFQQGWAEHEWRFRLPGHTTLPMNRLLPNITPRLDLQGRQVLVTQEEGFGDTLMYLRYLPLLAARGAIIRVWGAENMATLCARIEGVHHVQVGGETPSYDYHCPFISLPRAFSATAHPFGVPVPYVRADPDGISRFAALMPEDGRLRVGLVWSGAPRPDQSDAWMLDQRRSMKLEALAPLLDLDRTTFYSLQIGEAAQQRLAYAGRIVDLTDRIGTMDDTAALVANLDIVVSVDTAMVHLAGAMGKPVILMDRVNPCWRWMSDRTDSPWYPTLRIIRQSRAWQWEDVVAQVRTRLEQFRRNAS